MHFLPILSILQHPRYRKGKARIDPCLEPAVPNPHGVKHRTDSAVSPQSRSSEMNRLNTSLQLSNEPEKVKNSPSQSEKVNQSSEKKIPPRAKHNHVTQLISTTAHLEHPSNSAVHQELPPLSSKSIAQVSNSQSTEPQQHHAKITHVEQQPIHSAPSPSQPASNNEHFADSSNLATSLASTQQYEHKTVQSFADSVEDIPLSNPVRQAQSLVQPTSQSQRQMHKLQQIQQKRQAQPAQVIPNNDLAKSNPEPPMTSETSPGAQGVTKENVPHATIPGNASNEPSSRPAADDIFEMDNIAKLVSGIKAPTNGSRTRPLICQDITNSNADTLRLARLPRGVTYDRLLSMVEPFGEVEDLAWSPSDPYVCDVTYRDPAAAHEAKHFLGDALVGNDGEPPLKAELRSRDPGAQLFVGDLTPDVTEEMLEATFSELVGEPVTALLKRDPDSFSPIGYGFLSFKNESSANFALVAGHRAKIGNANVRVGRAERNTYLYVSDLSSNVSMDEVRNVFGRFGSLVEEDTVIVRRSYAFIRYKNRNAAEKAKRTLDKTDLRGRLSVRYAEAEPLKACVAVQFHSSVPRPPNSLKDLLQATFSKHGNCSVEIPRLGNGMWRKVAFVTFHGEPVAANLAALEAVQSIRFVSSLPVCCQFARELIPRLPSRGLSYQKLSDSAKQRSLPTSEGPPVRHFFGKKNGGRRGDQANEVPLDGSQNRRLMMEQRNHPFKNESGSHQGPDFVPVYVPITALQHPNQQVPSGGMQATEGDFSGYHWPNRMMMPTSSSTQQHSHHHGAPVNHSYNSFAPLQNRVMRW